MPACNILCWTVTADCGIAGVSQCFLAHYDSFIPYTQPGKSEPLEIVGEGRGKDYARFKSVLFARHSLERTGRAPEINRPCNCSVQTLCLIDNQIFKSEISYKYALGLTVSG